MKSLAFLILLAFSLTFTMTTAQAQTSSISLQVTPSNPTTATPIRVHLTVQGCVIVEDFRYQQTGSTFDIRVQTPDHCHPDHVIPEMYLDIGLLPAGEYIFRYFGCGFAPPGVVTCVQTREETIVVAAAAPTHVVPSLSLAGKWALATLMMLGTAVLLRR